MAGPGLSTHDILAVTSGLGGVYEISDTISHYCSNGRGPALVTATTINEGAAFAVGDTTLTVASGAVFKQDCDAKKPIYIKVGDEIMKVTGVSTNDLTVARGQFSTLDAEHADGATVYFYTPYDRWVGFFVVADTVFHADTTGESMGDFTSHQPRLVDTYSAGATIPMPLTRVQLASGKLLMFCG